MAAGAAVAAAIVALIVGIGDLGRQARPAPPADRSERIDGQRVVTIPDVRATQVVVEPSVHSTFTPGEGLLASVSIDDPEYDEITLPLDRGKQIRWEVSCTGAPEAWYVVLIEPEADYFSTGRCDGAREAGVSDRLDSSPASTLRVFVTDEDPAEFRRCFNFSPPEGCDGVEPRPAENSDASLQATFYADEPGPVAVLMFGQQIYARASAFDSTYSLTAAAAAVTGARELTFRVAPSTHQRIVQATLNPTEHWGECVQNARGSAQEACLPTVQLLVDGRPVEEQLEGPFDGVGHQAGWGPLSPESGHLITFRVTEGDPRNVDLGVMVYEEDR